MHPTQLATTIPSLDMLGLRCAVLLLFLASIRAERKDQEPRVNSLTAESEPTKFRTVSTPAPAEIYTEEWRYILRRNGRGNENVDMRP